MQPPSVLSGFYNDPSKATNDLQEFADANENRLYKLIRLAMDPQTDLKTLVKVNVRPYSLLLTPLSS
jgi:sister-chromatid-cohesion protein PDS5